MRKLRATSLLEVIIAVAITSSAIYGGIQASMKAINTIRDLENRNTAALLLDEIANRIQTNYSTVIYPEKYTTANLPYLQQTYTSNFKSLCYLNNNAPFDYCTYHGPLVLPSVINMTEWLTKVQNDLPGGDGIVCFKGSSNYSDNTSPNLSQGCGNNLADYIAKVKWKNSNNDDVVQYVTIPKPQYQTPVAKNTPAYDKCSITTTFTYNISTVQSSYGYQCLNAPFTITIKAPLNCNNRTVFDTPPSQWPSNTTIRIIANAPTVCGATAIVRSISSVNPAPYNNNNFNTFNINSNWIYMDAFYQIWNLFTWSWNNFYGIPDPPRHPLWLNPFLNSIDANVFASNNSIPVLHAVGATGIAPSWNLHIQHISTTNDFKENCGLLSTCPEFYQLKDYAPALPACKDTLNTCLPTYTPSLPICGSDGFGICLNGGACNLINISSKQYVCAGDPAFSTCPSGKTLESWRMQFDNNNLFYFCRQ